MNLVAFNVSDNSFFRQVSLNPNEDLDALKSVMQDDTSDTLVFEIMTDQEFDDYLNSLPKSLIPTTEERILELENMILMMMEVM